MKTGIFESFARSRHLRYGLPFVIFIVGSSFALKTFGQVRYDYRKTREIPVSDKEKYGLTTPTPTLENAYEEYMKKDYSENYEMIRGPRQYERDTLIQHEERRQQRLAEKKAHRGSSSD